MAEELKLAGREIQDSTGRPVPLASLELRMVQTYVAGNRHKSTGFGDIAARNAETLGVEYFLVQTDSANVLTREGSTTIDTATVSFYDRKTS